MTETTKKVNGKLAYIRICYWIGVIMDALVAISTLILMASPSGTFVNQIFNYGTLTNTLYAILAMEVPLMTGWTVLLVWADRKPIERRGVILITLVPVITGILLSNSIGFVAGNPVIPAFALVTGSILAILYSISYFFAHQLAKENKKERET